MGTVEQTRRTASATHAGCGVADGATLPLPPDCRAPRGAHVVPRGGAPLPPRHPQCPLVAPAALRSCAERLARRLPVSGLSMPAVFLTHAGKGTGGPRSRGRLLLRGGRRLGEE